MKVLKKNWERKILEQLGKSISTSSLVTNMRATIGGRGNEKK